MQAWSECVDKGREDDLDFVQKCQEQVPHSYLHFFEDALNFELPFPACLLQMAFCTLKNSCLCVVLRTGRVGSMGLVLLSTQPLHQLCPLPLLHFAGAVSFDAWVDCHIDRHCRPGTFELLPHVD